MNRGDVVQVNWPYSDQMGSKVRPAVVVQADFLNGLLDDTILVHITSAKHGTPNTEVEIDPTQEINSGLSRLCYASCTNFLTLDQTLVQRHLGYLSAATMQSIEQCVKTVLGLL
jgi:mRNA-degrading endonuclease toxin of MazEF toxin-antitoxin module